MKEDTYETVLNEIKDAEIKLENGPKSIRDALSWMRSQPIMHTCTHIKSWRNKDVKEYFDALPIKEFQTVWSGYSGHRARVKKISEGIFLMQHPLRINAFDVDYDCVSVVSRKGLENNVRFELNQVSSILQEATNKANKMADFLVILLSTKEAML